MGIARRVRTGDQPGERGRGGVAEGGGLGLHGRHRAEHAHQRHTPPLVRDRASPPRRAAARRVHCRATARIRDPRAQPQQGGRLLGGGATGRRERRRLRLRAARC